MANDNTIRIAFEQLAEPETPRPIQPQETPKAPETRPTMMAPPAPAAPEPVPPATTQPVLSPVQEAIVAQQGRAKAMETEISTLKQEEAAQAQIPFGEQIKMGVEPKLRQFPEEKVPEILAEPARVVGAGVEGYFKEAANLFPGFQEHLRRERDDYGQPIREYSLDPATFTTAPKTKLGLIASEFVTQGIASLTLGSGFSALAGVKGTAMTARAARIIGRLGATDKAQTFLGKVGSTMFVNGIENIVQDNLDSRPGAVMGVEDLMRMGGIAEDIPDVLQRNGKLSTLQDKVARNVSVFLTGATVNAPIGAAAGAIIQGISKVIVGSLGKRSDDLIDNFVDKNRGPDGKAKLVPVGVTQENFDQMIEDGINDIADGMANSAPPPKTGATGGGGGGAPPAPPVPPVPPGGGRPPMGIDEAKQILRQAMEDLGPEFRDIETVERGVRELGQGKAVAEAVTAGDVSRLSNNIDVMIERLAGRTDEQSMNVRQAALTVFMDSFRNLLDSTLSDSGKFTKGRAGTALDVIDTLNKAQVPAFIVNNADDAVIGPMAVKSMNDTFEFIISKLDPTEVGVLRTALTEHADAVARYTRAGINPDELLTQSMMRALGGEPRGALSAAQMLTNMTLTKDTLVRIVNALKDVDISTLDDRALAEYGNAIFNAFRGMKILKALNAGTLEAGKIPGSTAGLNAQFAEAFLKVPDGVDPAKYYRDLLESLARSQPGVTPEIKTIAGEAKPRIPVEQTPVPPQDIVTVVGNRVTPVIDTGVTDAERAMRILRSLNSSLGDTVIALGRAGVLDNAQLARIAEIVGGGEGQVSDELSMFLMQIFNREQRDTLMRIQAVNDIFRSKPREGFGDIPLGTELPIIAGGRGELGDNIPERLAALEQELSDRLGLFGEKAGIPVPKDPDDLLKITGVGKGIPFNRIIDRLLSGSQRALLTFSQMTVLAGNTATYLVDGVGALIRGAKNMPLLNKLVDNDPVSQLAWWRGKQMLSFNLMRAQSLARMGRAVKAAGRSLVTGRSTLLGESQSAIDAINKLRTGRALAEIKPGLFESDPKDSILTRLRKAVELKGEKYLAGERIGLEAAADIGPKGIAFMDELFKQRYYGIEYRAALIAKALESGKMSFKQAEAYADKEWADLVNTSVLKTEAEMYRQAAEKVRANLNFDEKADPLTFAAAVELQFKADLEQMNNVVGDAPLWLKQTNAQIQEHLKYVAGSLDLDGTKAGLLAQMFKGNNGALDGILRTLVVFPQTVVNEILRVADLGAQGFMGGLRFARIQSVGLDAKRLNEMPDYKTWETKTAGYISHTSRELLHPDVAVRSRAEGRVAIAALLVYGYIIKGAVDIAKGQPQTVKEGLPGVEVSTERGALGVEEPMVPQVRTGGSKIIKQAAQTLEIEPGTIAGQRIPVITPVIGVAQELPTTIATGVEAVFKGLEGLLGESADEAMDYESGSSTAADRFSESILKIADYIGATDVVETFSNFAEDPIGSTFSDVARRIVSLPFGGSALWGLFAEFGSDYKLGSRANAPTGYMGAGKASFDNVRQFLGGKGPIKRDRYGVRVKSGILNDLATTLLKYKGKSEFDFGNGKSLESNRTLMAVLAANGYTIKPLLRDLNDPVAARSAPGSIDLKKHRMADGRTAYEHLADYFVMGTTKQLSVSQLRNESPVGGIGGANNQTLIEYLSANIDPTKLKEVNLRADKTDPAYAAAQESIKAINALITARQNAALELLFQQSDAEAAASPTRKSLRRDFPTLAGGVR